LNVFNVTDLAQFDDGRNLIRVCFDAALGDDVPQEFALRDFNGAFLQVQLNLELPKVVEGFFQVGNEAVALLRLYDDVVDIDLLVAPYLPFEAELHAPLVYSPRVFQSK
jgi:hypothetical protein